MKRTAYLALLILLSLAGVGPRRASAVKDETLCPVHHVPLLAERVQLLYGLVARDPCETLDRVQAREKYFPYANSSAYGGGIKSSDAPDYRDVSFCPRCREVEKTWPCLETRGTAIVNPVPASRITTLPTVH